MCIYGIEILPDNITECRANLIEIFSEYLNLSQEDELYHAASYVASQNLVHGDALSMRKFDTGPIVFPEWGYVGKGRFQRRDFQFESLTNSSDFNAEDSLFSDLGREDIFIPTEIYLPMTIGQIAAIEEQIDL